MFTIEQINDIHDQWGKADSLLPFLAALKAIGVDKCDSFIHDGHSEYTGGGHMVRSSAAHEELPVADSADPAALREHLARHASGKTSYVELSQGLAESGVEKWTFDTDKKTVTYYDKSGQELLSEQLR